MKEVMITFGYNMRIQCTYFSSILMHLLLCIVPDAAIGALPPWMASGLLYCDVVLHLLWC